MKDRFKTLWTQFQRLHWILRTIVWKGQRSILVVLLLLLLLRNLEFDVGFCQLSFSWRIFGRTFFWIWIQRLEVFWPKCHRSTWTTWPQMQCFSNAGKTFEIFNFHLGKKLTFNSFSVFMRNEIEWWEWNHRWFLPDLPKLHQPKSLCSGLGLVYGHVRPGLSSTLDWTVHYGQFNIPFESHQLSNGYLLWTQHSRLHYGWMQHWRLVCSVPNLQEYRQTFLPWIDGAFGIDVCLQHPWKHQLQQSTSAQIEQKGIRRIWWRSWNGTFG